MTPALTAATLPGAIAELSARDPDLASVVSRHGPPPLWARPAGFATLVRIVLEQQVSLASARAARARLDRGAGGLSARRLAALSPAEVRRLGITRQKADFILGIARAVATREIDLRLLSRLDDEAARAALLRIRGVGAWTADIYLLMALRRPDVWPDGDLALARAIRRLKRLPRDPDVRESRRIAAAWSPWRAVAARILWHHYLSETLPARPATGHFHRISS